MVLHIALPPDTETKLRERAAAEGKDPVAFVVEAVEEKLGGTNGPTHQRTCEDRAAAWGRFVSNMREWTKTLPPGHRIDDTRESIYEGRGE